MERIQTSTVTRQFKRTFGEATLNELGRISRFCRRERDVTPFRLALSLIESFASGSANCIADIQRAFNALCETTVCYKPFHNQLAKRQFPTFVRLLLSRLLNELAVEVLRFNTNSPFARFERIHIQDGSSFARYLQSVHCRRTHLGRVVRRHPETILRSHDRTAPPCRHVHSHGGQVRSSSARRCVTRINPSTTGCESVFATTTHLSGG